VLSDQIEASHAPRTRRTVLKGAAAAAAASWLATERADAAPGDPVRQGRANNAGAARTTLVSRARSATLLVTNTTGPGIVARASRRNALAVHAMNTARRSGNGAALRAEARRLDGVQGGSRARNHAGVVGINRTRNVSAVGVVGLASRGVGVLGIATGRGLGFLSAGNAVVDGDLFVTGRILQPAAAAAGTAELNGSGTALVRTPATERGAQYDYQLTAIGAAMPNLHVVEGAEGSFTIRGGKPGGRVSWQRATRAEAGLMTQSALDKQLPDLSGYLDR
jgi:hypothetical protein